MTNDPARALQRIRQEARLIEGISASSDLRAAAHSIIAEVDALLAQPAPEGEKQRVVGAPGDNMGYSKSADCDPAANPERSASGGHEPGPTTLTPRSRAEAEAMVEKALRAAVHWEEGDIEDDVFDAARAALLAALCGEDK